MASESDRSYEFNFSWSIHNFSHLALEEEEAIESPKFVVEFLKDSEFHLALFTRNMDRPNFISCYLYQVKELPTFSYGISIHNFGKAIMREYSGPNEGDPELLRLDDLSKYLENDTLTVHCRILKTNVDFPKSVECCAYTKIKVLNLDYTWSLDDILDSNHVFKSKINKTTEILANSSGIPAFKMHLLNGLNAEDHAIHFAIERTEDITFFLVFVINLLDANGSVAHFIKGRILFEKSATKQILDLPFVSKPKLLSNDKLYLPSGKLNIHCEFAISTNDVQYEISSIKCRSINDIQIKPSQNSIVSPDGHELWKESSRKFFIEGKSSDFIIRSADKDFPVHKAILAAQSEVFFAMFEHDMKERNTGVVQIEDLENDVILKLLTYIYTNTIEDIDCPTAQKLYFAADRYGVTALRRICSRYLAGHIDTSNVCELLVLADTHQDEELKSCTEYFIFEHARDIIDSEDWKRIMKTHSHLTSETMQRMFCKKMLKDLKP